MKNITILGSTGSIGTQTLDIVRANDDLRVVAIAAGSNIQKLEEQIREFHPEIVCVYNEEAAANLKIAVADTSVKVVAGMDGLIETAVYKGADIVVTAFVGMIGIRPTLEAIKAGKDIALANKETLVTAGHLVIQAAKDYGVKILPVDSEHSAIFQSLNGENRKEIDKILLTASGGPFRGRTREQMKDVKVEDALKHPNWTMGRKITIDSATMVNKGLEVIEAKWLFDLQPEQITVLVHRQSVMHSGVMYADNSVIAQLGVPDMRLPIQYAILYPERKPCPVAPLSLTQYATLTFAEPDEQTFRCLALAKKAMQAGGLLPCVMNGANEIAVQAFLQGKIGFLEIADYVETAMRTVETPELHTCADVLKTDQKARELVQNLIQK